MNQKSHDERTNLKPVSITQIRYSLGKITRNGALEHVPHLRITVISNCCKIPKLSGSTQNFEYMIDKKKWRIIPINREVLNTCFMRD